MHTRKEVQMRHIEFHMPQLEESESRMTFDYFLKTSKLIFKGVQQQTLTTKEAYILERRDMCKDVIK